MHLILHLKQTQTRIKCVSDENSGNPFRKQRHEKKNTFTKRPDYRISEIKKQQKQKRSSDMIGGINNGSYDLFWDSIVVYYYM
jgi:hypothetical protein